MRGFRNREGLRRPRPWVQGCGPAGRGGAAALLVLPPCLAAGGRARGRSAVAGSSNLQSSEFSFSLFMFTFGLRKPVPDVLRFAVEPGGHLPRTPSRAGFRGGRCTAVSPGCSEMPSRCSAGPCSPSLPDPSAQPERSPSLPGVHRSSGCRAGTGPPSRAR